MRRGFWLSLEAGIMLCLLGIALASFKAPQGTQSERLVIEIKESDLLGIWTKRHYIETARMLLEAKSAFPGNFVEIESGSEKVSCCGIRPKSGKGVIAMTAIIATQRGNEKVVLRVFQ